MLIYQDVGTFLPNVAKERAMRLAITGRRQRTPSPLQAMVEANRDRGVSVWGSSFTLFDDNGLPVKGGGVVLDDGTVLAGEAAPIRGWTPFDDSHQEANPLPEPWETVWIFDESEHGGVLLGQWNPDGWWVEAERGGGPTYDITHWMPLEHPNPPVSV